MNNGDPAWTESGSKGGLDHLGMQLSSIRAYQDLVPGISNVTIRIRYYSLYTWLVDDHARITGSTDREAWRRRIRRAEALYALIGTAAGRHDGLAGTEWASRTLPADDSLFFFANDDADDPEPKHLDAHWGAYGQAYASQMHAVGLLAQAAAHEIPIVTPDLGEPLAKAFEDAIGPAASMFRATLDAGLTRRSDLSDMRRMLPDVIEPHKGEGRLLADLLIGADDRPDEHNDRMRTCRAIIAMEDDLASSLDAATFRWTAYAGRFPDGTPFESPAILNETIRRWRCYQANELCHVAFEAILCRLLTVAGGVGIGMPIHDLIDRMVIEAVPDPRERREPLRNILETGAFPINAADPEEELSERAHADYLMNHAIDGAATDEVVPAAVSLLGLLQRRTAGGFYGDEPFMQEVTGSSDARSLWTERGFLLSLMDLPAGLALRMLFEERVVERHASVALGKMAQRGDYTYLFEMDEGSIRRRAGMVPVWTGPRIGNALRFLRDVGILHSSQRETYSS